MTKQTRFKLTIAGLMYLGLLLVAAFIWQRYFLEVLGALTAFFATYVVAETKRSSSEGK